MDAIGEQLLKQMQSRSSSAHSEVDAIELKPTQCSFFVGGGGGGGGGGGEHLFVSP